MTKKPILYKIILFIIISLTIYTGSGFIMYGHNNDKTIILYIGRVLEFIGNIILGLVLDKIEI